MNEAIVVTASREAGVQLLDIQGAPISSRYKGNVSEPGTVTFLRSQASFSGSGASDFFCISQAAKPTVTIWHWTKSQPLMVCQVQEVMTSLTSDPTGTYIIGGSNKGSMTVWDVHSGDIVRTWKAHFREISRLDVSIGSDFCVSSSIDGMVRVWDICSIVDTSDFHGNRNSNPNPYRSWTPHSLAVTDLYLLKSPQSARVISCSLDHSVVMFDYLANQQIFRLSLDQPLLSVECNPTFDFIFSGASNGDIFVLSTSEAAINTCTVVNAQIVRSSQSSYLNHRESTANSSDGGGRPMSVNRSHSKSSPTVTLCGHTKSVVSLSCSSDNITLVSASEDGSLRVWDMWTRQCLHNLRPFSGVGLTNAIIIRKPEHLRAGVSKPFAAPIQHLKKFVAEGLGTGGEGDAVTLLGSRVNDCSYLFSNRNKLRVDFDSVEKLASHPGVSARSMKSIFVASTAGNTNNHSIPKKADRKALPLGEFEAITTGDSLMNVRAKKQAVALEDPQEYKQRIQVPHNKTTNVEKSKHAKSARPRKALRQR